MMTTNNLLTPAQLVELNSANTLPQRSCGVMDFLKELEEVEKLNQLLANQKNESYLFKDGMEVDSVYRPAGLIHTGISVSKSKSYVFVYVNDSRFVFGSQQCWMPRYQRRFVLPHDFMSDLLEKKVLGLIGSPPALFRAQLGLLGQELHVYDRAAKLRALQEVLAS